LKELPRKLEEIRGFEGTCLSLDQLDFRPCQFHKLISCIVLHSSTLCVGRDCASFERMHWRLTQVSLGRSKNSASSPSPDALQLLLETDGTDVDLQNRLDRATPLHLAVKLENEGARQGVIEMLLDAGANPRCVKFLSQSSR